MRRRDAEGLQDFAALRRRLDGAVRHRSALFAARREGFTQAVALTQRYAPIAVATLVKVMNDASSPPSSKVSAAGMLLKFGREGMELDDLAERVERLERGATPPVKGDSSVETGK